MTEPFTLTLVVATFLLAGWVKGVVGMGLPTVAMGALGLAMPPVQAAALLVVPSLVTNLWQFLAGPSPLAMARRLATMLLGVCAGTALGIGLLTSSASQAPSLALGAVLLAYAVVGLKALKLQVPPRVERTMAPVVGAVTGVLTGATGVFVVPAVPYLSALGLSKDELIQALGLSFTVSTVALAVALGASHSYSGPLLWLSVGALVPALIGMFVGQAVRDRLDPVTFKRWFFIAMALVGAYMMARALWKTAA